MESCDIHVMHFSPFLLLNWLRLVYIHTYIHICIHTYILAVPGVLDISCAKYGDMMRGYGGHVR